MKILVIGNANSIFIKEYVENVLLGNHDQICIASDSDGEMYGDFYKNNSVNLTSLYPNLGILRGIPVLPAILQAIWQSLKFFGKYDIIHVHYVLRYRFMNVLALGKPRIIYSYWGSDLLRRSDADIRKERKRLQKASFITLTSKHMIARLRDVYSSEFDHKIKAIKFGNSGFDAIDRVLQNEDKEACKAFFSIEANKTVISVGYNRHLAQQHLEVIKCLVTLTESERKKIHLVFQMTYGTMPEDYPETVVNAASGLGCTYSIFTDYMTGEDVARLRIATDIFIHAQISDSLSATVLAYLYCGTAVVNPTWIKYEELKDLGIHYTEYSDFSELAGIVSAVISAGIPHNLSNVEKLRDSFSWPSVRNQWRGLY